MAADALSTTFAALADPTRRAILQRLADGEATVLELAEPFDITLPAVTKHLKVLERAKLIKRSKRAQWRPCELEAKPLQEVASWIEHYREFWEASFDRLERYLSELQAKQSSGEAPSASKAASKRSKPKRKAAKKAAKGRAKKAPKRTDAKSPTRRTTKRKPQD